MKNLNTGLLPQNVHLLSVTDVTKIVDCRFVFSFAFKFIPKGLGFSIEMILEEQINHKSIWRKLLAVKLSSVVRCLLG